MNKTHFIALLFILFGTTGCLHFQHWQSHGLCENALRMIEASTCEQGKKERLIDATISGCRYPKMKSLSWVQKVNRLPEPLQCEDPPQPDSRQNRESRLYPLGRTPLDGVYVFCGNSGDFS